MEIALDFAVQCSPDHPWLAQHPEWFKRRPDGSIQYAENPPKKYEDIVNPDFYGARPRGPVEGVARRRAVLGRTGRAHFPRRQSPHQAVSVLGMADPGSPGGRSDVIFLSEAFTRPKVMKALAKLGFTQSYTYFTWRTGKDELQAYLSEITGYPEREYFRPNFFVNTPDILPFHLQTGEPWMFKARVALAATLSSNYGIYNGFELLEHEPIPGKEEYLDSEKYELKVRDWDSPATSRTTSRQLNRMRQSNPALLQTSKLRFAQVDDAEVIGFVKELVATRQRGRGRGGADKSRTAGILVSLRRHRDRPAGASGVASDAIENLVTGERHMLEWGGVRLRIDQEQDPALLFRCIA